MKYGIRHFILLCALFVSAQLNATSPDIFETIIERLRSQYIAEKDTSGASRILSAQTDNGSWNSIDYSDASKAAWQPREHLRSLQTMALAYQDASHNLYKNEKLLNGIINGINFWYDTNPKSPNWWHNKIGKQHHLAKIAITLYDELPAGLIAKIAGEMALSTEHYTGQNLLWMAEEIIWKGLFEKNTELVETGTRAIQSVVLISEDEGIMPDYSFRQHGPQLYSGGAGYGVPFLTSNIMWAYCLHGLPFAYNKEKINILAGYILDGSSWMIRRNFWDYQTTGRTLVRRGVLECSYLVNFLNLAAAIDSENKIRYLDFINHIEGNNDAYLSGNNYFAWSDYVVHRRENFFFSIRMNSLRTYRTENGNSENGKGRYLSDGGTTIMTKGDEYKNIFPCWNWANIPGTTTPLSNPIPPFKSWGSAGTTSFTGAVSDHSDGVAVYRMDYDSVRANKAWFMFDGIIVCMVSGINSSNEQPLATTLNQTTRKSNIWIKDYKGEVFTITDSISTLINAEKIWHDRVGYILPDHRESIQLNTSTKINDWREIGSYPIESLQKKEIVNLYKLHEDLKKRNSFVYILTPGISLNDFQILDTKNIDIINNNTVCQVVADKKSNTYGAVLHEAGTVKMSDQLTFSSSHPCLLLIKIIDDQLIVTVSDPTQELRETNLAIHYKKTKFKANISLPSGKEKGNSVSKSFKIE